MQTCKEGIMNFTERRYLGGGSHYRGGHNLLDYKKDL